MVRHLTVCSSLLFSTVILFAPTAFAEDLAALVKEYREAAATERRKLARGRRRRRSRPWSTRSRGSARMKLWPFF